MELDSYVLTCPHILVLTVTWASSPRSIPKKRIILPYITRSTKCSLSLIHSHTHVPQISATQLYFNIKIRSTLRSELAIRLIDSLRASKHDVGLLSFYKPCWSSERFWNPEYDFDVIVNNLWTIPKLYYVELSIVEYRYQVTLIMLSSLMKTLPQKIGKISYLCLLNCLNVVCAIRKLSLC